MVRSSDDSELYDRDAIWGLTHDESTRSREVWQVGDAAFCQITLDTCYYWLHIYHLPRNILRVSWIVSFLILTDRFQCTKMNEWHFVDSKTGVLFKAQLYQTHSPYSWRFKNSWWYKCLCKYAGGITCLILKCVVKIADELENIIGWSSANKLRLNLGKSKEIMVFRC